MEASLVTKGCTWLLVVFVVSVNSLALVICPVIGSNCMPLGPVKLTPGPVYAATFASSEGRAAPKAPVAL